MGRWTRRLLALALALCVGWHGAGVVNAVEYDPQAHCCCGDHDAAVPCDCPVCPGHGSLRFRTAPREPEPPAAPSLRGCGARFRPAALVTLAPALFARPPTLWSPSPTGRAPSIVRPPPPARLRDSVSPPP